MSLVSRTEVRNVASLLKGLTFHSAARHRSPDQVAKRLKGKGKMVTIESPSEPSTPEKLERQFRDDENARIEAEVARWTARMEQQMEQRIRERLARE